MGVDLQPFCPGAVVGREDENAARACESLVIAFCERMDAGDVHAAVELHTKDVIFYDVARPAPLIGLEAMESRLLKVRFSHEGRLTLHVPSNIQVMRTSDTTCQGTYIVALYDLVPVVGGRGIGARSTEFMGFAREKVVFRLESGAWWFAEREVSFVGGMKRLPIGTRPSGLPFSELE